MLENPRSDRVKHVRALHARSARKRHGQYLVEGPQGVREAVRYAPDDIRDIYATTETMERYPDIFEDAAEARLWVHQASPDVISAMSGDAQGVIAVLHRKDRTLADVDLSSARNVAVLCCVRDPGNAGTVIRAADAAGADLVILSDESVDIFNPKVVRSTAGSMFHLPVISGVAVEEIAAGLRTVGIQIFAATGSGAYDLDDLLDSVGPTRNGAVADKSTPDAAAPTAWFFGNEAQGLSQVELSLADYSVRVPLRGRAESLNVATAATVCLYATSRAQR
ncbi:TrmH family RNA methyltransferase [Populibacterium corticicola]|uniref:TrmH family RNA methyltransferase n=1 Tax=Populibacterium corticicola TaxID=1812826 RepID=A0ABW5XJ01_9MICO